jgi:hypothetical protein
MVFESYPLFSILDPQFNEVAMTKTALFSIGGLTLLLALLLACSSVALAVRQGAIPEVLVRVPPNTDFQIILRIGEDSPPWRRNIARSTAINVWAHEQGTAWHIATLVHISLGASEADQ